MAAELGFARERPVDSHRLFFEAAFASVASAARVEYAAWPEGERRVVPASTLLRARLRYAYLRRVLAGRVDLRVGPGMASLVDTLSWYFGSGASFGYYASFGLEAAARARVRVDAKRALECVALPFFAWVARFALPAHRAKLCAPSGEPHIRHRATSPRFEVRGPNRTGLSSKSSSRTIQRCSQPSALPSLRVSQSGPSTSGGPPASFVTSSSPPGQRAASASLGQPSSTSSSGKAA